MTPGVCTPRATYTDEDRGAQVCLPENVGQPIVKLGGEAKCLTGVMHSAQKLHRFGNRGGDCLGTHDAHYVVTGHYQLGTITVMLCQPRHAIQMRTLVH
jgi:hypothetical protein